MPLERDDFFAGCRIIHACGHGGSGVVYLAENAIGRRVAIKVMDSRDAGEKELRGIRNYMLIHENEPSLVTIHHAGIEHDSFFYIMDAADNASQSSDDYIPDTLANRLKASGRIPLDEAIGMCLALVDGLAVMHKAGFLHRDIKPENILFIHGMPVLGDPGLVGDYSTTLSISGTLGYLPPEFFHGTVKPSPMTDIYALGKVLYCVVTGNAPGEFPTIPQKLDEDTLARICRLLARLCNADPKRRCADCGECRRLLLEARLKHGRIWRVWWRFREDVLWRRKAILRVLCCSFAVLFLAGIVCVMRHSHRKVIESRQRAQAEIESQINAFRARQPELSMQFDAMGEPNPADEWLKRIDAAVADGRWEDSKRDLSCAADELTGCALRHAKPETLPEDATPAERIDANARLFAFLNSPLCKWHLPCEQAEKMRQDAEKEASRLAKMAGNGNCINGKSVQIDRGVSMKMLFVPPGRFRSSVTGRVEEIKRPFWIMESELTFRQFECFAHDIDRTHSLLEQPAVQYGWNDYLGFCKNLTIFIRKAVDLPKGYAFRPPTEAEWEFASIGGTAYQLPVSEPNDKKMADSPEMPLPQNALNVMGMDRNISELVLPYSGFVREGGWTVARGANFNDATTGVTRRIEERMDQQTFKHIGFRPVLAPVEDGFFDSAWHLPLHARQGSVDGKFYVGFECCQAWTTWKMAEDFVRAVGGRLPEPKSLGELAAIYDAVKADLRFPAFLGIVWRDGKWRQSDGTVSPFAENAPVPTEDSARTCLGSAPHVKYFPVAPDLALPAWIVEFESKEAFLKRPRHPCVEVFEIDGRRFGLLKIRAAAPLHSAVVEFAGYRVPVLAEKETLAKVLERLKSVKGSVSLCCHRVYDDWLWADSSKLPCDAPQEWHGRHNPHATMGYCVVVSSAGKLRIASDSNYILVEF